MVFIWLLFETWQNLSPFTAIRALAQVQEWTVGYYIWDKNSWIVHTMFPEPLQLSSKAHLILSGQGLNCYPENNGSSGCAEEAVNCSMLQWQSLLHYCNQNWCWVFTRVHSHVKHFSYQGKAGRNFWITGIPNKTIDNVQRTWVARHLNISCIWKEKIL